VADSRRRTLGRDCELRRLLDHAAATQHRDAVDDERVPQEIRDFASGICAIGCAVFMHDQRAVAVVDVQATVRTPTHAVFVPAGTASMRYYVGVSRICVDLVSAALLRRVGSGRRLRWLLLLLFGCAGTRGRSPPSSITR
jgi:hypothetical protein